MRKHWWIGGGIAAVVMVAGVAVYASMGGGKKPDGKDDKVAAALQFLPAEVTKPQKSTMPARVEFSGPLVAPNTVIVKAKAAGTLVSLAVAEGSRVRAGQALGQLDLEELRFRVAERNATLESAKAQYDQTARQYEANKGLAANSFIAQTALDNSRAQMDAAKAQWLAAKAQLDTSEVLLRQAALVSPIDGIVSKRWTLPGEKVAAEQQVLTIVDLSRLELAGLVGTHEIGRLHPGMAVQVMIEGEDKPVEATINRISPMAEPGTRSITVVLSLANAGEHFRAGQYAMAAVELPDETQRLTLPDTAVAGSNGENQVWTIEKGALVRHSVTVGRRDERAGRIEIVRGLNPDAEVLAAHFDNLHEGGKAVVVADHRPTVASAASGAMND
ncbi:MAG: efflux RND transporter periplasmic adaptor subunit [Paucibacter sp.]|nr:efflux RND transporter periplasmic adaptor subunit [Roseateles sp.]